MGGLFQQFWGRGWDFQELGHLLAFDGWPQNCHGASGCSIWLADVLQRVYTEAQGLVEADLSAILNLFGSNQFMSCPQAMSFF